MSKHNWYVEIRPHTEDESDPGFRRMGPMSEHHAERVENGANINLNHEKYYTRICRPPKKGEELPQSALDIIESARWD